MIDTRPMLGVDIFVRFSASPLAAALRLSLLTYRVSHTVFGLPGISQNAGSVC